jgi:hypothetical protein
VNHAIRGRWGRATTRPTWVWATRKGYPGCDPEWFLSTGRSGAGSNTYGSDYDVMARRELYLEFSNLDPDNRDQLDVFANRYGLLGTAVEIDPQDKLTYSQALIFGEPWLEWRHFIREVAEARRFRDAILRGNDGYLEKHLRRLVELDKGKQKQSPVGWHYSSSVFTVSIVDEQEMRWNPEAGDLDEMKVGASVILCRWISARLSEHAVPFVWHSSKTAKPEFRLMPRNLLGAIWLQLAFAFSTHSSYQDCEQCGKTFELTRVDLANPRKKRADQKYCSDACKSRAYRVRKQSPAEKN